ncbi:MAG: ATPase, partial [Cyanobacteria bacterium J06628_6]
VAASSYELRSELNRMLGCLNLLSDQGQIPLAEQEEFVASAYNSAVDLLGIVERLENTGLVTAKSQDN